MECPDLFHRRLEGVHALAQLCQEIRVLSRKHGAARRLISLATVQIKIVYLTKEYLSFHSEPIVRTARCPMPCFDQSRNHLELRAQRGIESDGVHWIGHLIH